MLLPQLKSISLSLYAQANTSHCPLGYITLRGAICPPWDIRSPHSGVETEVNLLIFKFTPHHQKGTKHVTFKNKGPNMYQLHLRTAPVPFSESVGRN